MDIRVYPLGLHISALPLWVNISVHPLGLHTHDSTHWVHICVYPLGLHGGFTLWGFALGGREWSITLAHWATSTLWVPFGIAFPLSSFGVPLSLVMVLIGLIDVR